jgi:diguanylate cyclase (GGDEF)-like protein/PAS domain S-box-containing protein
MDSVGGSGAASRPGRALHEVPGGDAGRADGRQAADQIDLAQRAAEELRAAAALMTEAQRVANFGSWEWRVDDDTVTWSEQLYRILGLDPTTFQATFDAYLDRIHPDDRDRVVETIGRAMDEGVPYRFEHRLLRPDGGERWVRCNGEPLIAPGGEVTRVVGVCQDVTELVHSERARLEADMRFKIAFESAPIGIALVSFEEGPDPRLTEINRALCEIAQRREEELVGTSLSSLCHPDDADSDLVLRERLLAGEIERYGIEKRCLHPDGQLGWVQLNVSLIPGEHGLGRAGVVQVQDVTERKSSEDQLRHLADHDSLTGLLTRRRFREELDTQIALKRRYGGEGALLLLDVDRLKAINDTHGHAVGDEVLRRVGETLAKRVRSTDVVGRLAGDEFAILLPNASAAEADALAAALVERLSEQHIGGWGVSVSIGVAAFGDGQAELDAEAILAVADGAMYRAKGRGGAVSERAEPTISDLTRGRPLEAVPTPEPEAPELRTTPVLPARRFARPDSNSLREALARDELLVYGQPVVDLRTGDVAHRELLVRMTDARGQVLTAAQFLGSAARERGLCEEVDRWVITRALELLAQPGNAERLQVNLSGEILGDDEALRSVMAEVAATDVDPGRLAFEIGEGSIRREPTRAHRVLETLADAGFPLVLDGFSAAFGSFEYLQRLPLEQVKIDGSVIKRLTAETPDDATLRAIVRLATGTRKTTVAKLVDSEALVPLLRMHGVDMAQGFEIAEPELVPSG